MQLGLHIYHNAMFFECDFLPMFCDFPQQKLVILNFAIEGDVSAIAMFGTLSWNGVWSKAEISQERHFVTE